MKKYLLSATFGFAMVAMLFSSGKVLAQESLPGPDGGGWYIDLEMCYCDALVIKCRAEGFGACSVSSQIPCGEACGD